MTEWIVLEMLKGAWHDDWEGPVVVGVYSTEANALKCAVLTEIGATVRYW